MIVDSQIFGSKEHYVTDNVYFQLSILNILFIISLLKIYLNNFFYIKIIVKIATVGPCGLRVV